VHYEKPPVKYGKIIAVHQNCRQSDIDRGACVWRLGSDDHAYYFKDPDGEPEDRGDYDDFMQRLQKGRVLAREYND
jgi:hypothetical protein